MKKFLLLIHGPMGSGKTTVANLLHTKFTRTALIGLDRIKWFVSSFKRTKAYNEMTRDIIVSMTNKYLQHGINVIVEQAFPPNQIIIFKKIAKKYNVNFFVYQLEAPPHILLERVAERRKIKTNKPKISPARILRNMRIYERQRSEFSKIPKFDSYQLSAQKIATKILHDLRKSNKYS